MGIELESEKRDFFSKFPLFFMPQPLHGVSNEPLVGNGHDGGSHFNPLSGFHFGACEPTLVRSSLKKSISCDTPVISAILLLEGTCVFTLNGENATSFRIERNMFIMGQWWKQDVEMLLPQQESCSLVGFVTQDSALEEYFGRGMSSDVHSTLRRAMMKKPEGMNTISGIARPEVIMTARAILDMQREDTHDPLRFRCTVLDLFTKLLHNSAEGEAHTSILLHEQDKKSLAELKSVIEKDFRSVHSVADLCVGIGMSLSKANKAFKALYSTTISQYIQQCKMVYAYSELLHRQLNVSECAFAVGYSNVSHFITAFKKHFGMTPKAVSRLGTKESS